MRGSPPLWVGEERTKTTLKYALSGSICGYYGSLARGIALKFSTAAVYRARMKIRRIGEFTPARLSFSICFVVGGCVALICGPGSHKSRSTITQQQPTPTAAVVVKQASEPQEDSNQNSRIVPQAFAGLDFENHSYGSYRLPSGTTIDLRLNGGKLYYAPNEDRGWFAFKDAYYADVTGDGAPEAIVVLSHVQCGGSCDGGAALFYIYAARKHGLARIWRYETGSYGYGCGLKSFSVENKQIVVETFGRCPKKAIEDPGMGKFKVEDETRLVFRFDGQRVVRSALKYLSTPARDLKNYNAEIRIG